MDYTELSLDQFICDEYFQNWIFNPDKETIDFWEAFLRQYPEKKEIIDQARNVLLSIDFKEHEVPDGQVLRSLETTLARLKEEQGQAPLKSTRIIRFGGIKQLSRIAAVLIGLAITGSLIYYNYWNAKTTISTRYSEVKKFILPDGSSVVLNAHSRITFFKRQRSDRPRQVWLEGEGFFDVRHLNKNEREVSPSEKFLVTTEDLNVNVLGTTFDVKKRSQGTEVILASGKVRLDFNNKTKSPLTMKPGQMMVYDTDNHSSLLKTVDPDEYTTWMDKKLVLKEASVNEIIKYIQEYYGYNVKLEDTAIGNKRMEGTLLLDDIEDVLFVLSSTLHINIERQRDTLVISKRK